MRVVLVRGCHRPGHSLAGNVASAKHPRVPACVSKRCYYHERMVLPEARVIEESLSCSEMLLYTGEVATEKASLHLDFVHVPEIVTTARPESELERPVGKRCGGWETRRSAA